ncbi:hypothetical protein ATCV1_z161R [Acanthocystis turfacea chlorella virus 1]|uniref:Uncharacterized protein z161R n=1 Tax=Chlorovirus heliozoae TaxID=322019 RepID=A7K8C1_9PHYC|nr:hypothetical protein ATCV1_z161R [Acanthocystis turfacea chlorella virus 1]ABT16295.1 hypothetical protein ATCV1_z161R [Acanthocystis turfacea chlorella virus 1]
MHSKHLQKIYTVSVRLRANTLTRSTMHTSSLADIKIFIYVNVETYHHRRHSSYFGHHLCDDDAEERKLRPQRRLCDA